MPAGRFPAPGRRRSNKGGVVGAWLADLLLYLFGLSAWWWVVAGVALVVIGYRRPARATMSSAIIRGSRFRGSCWCCSPARRSRRCASIACRRVLPNGPGGASGDVVGQGLSHALGFNGATLVLIGVFGIGWSLLTGMSWLRLMERIGAAIERTLAWLRRRREAKRDRVIGNAAFEEREHVVEAARGTIDEREPVMVVPAGAGSDQVGARGQGEAEAAVPGPSGLAAAAARAARGRRRRRRRRSSAETLELHLARDRAQARRLRRRGEGAGGVSGPGDHALRDRARRRRQGRADRQPDEGPRARTVGGQHPRGRDDSRQVVHGTRAAEPAGARSCGWSSCSRRPRTTTRRVRCRSRSARTSPASPSSSTSRACRTCWSPARPARASRSRSTR